MENNNKESKINIEEDNEILLKTQNNNVTVTVGSIPYQNSNNETEEDNAKKEKPNILEQFSIFKVYKIALCVFSISVVLLLFIKEFEEAFYKIFRINIKEKKIGKRITPEYEEDHSRMDKEKSQNIIYSKYLIHIIYFCFIGPFVEEFLYRGLIFGFIKKYGQKVIKSDVFKGIFIIAFAVIISSILFSFGHFNIHGEDGYFEITFFRTYLSFEYVFMGIIYACIYYRYELILTTILVQMLFNITGTFYTLTMYASDCYDSCAVNIVAIAFPFYVFNIIVVIILIIKLIIKCCRNLKIN